jgi:hypothetical protein
MRRAALSGVTARFGAIAGSFLAVTGTALAHSGHEEHAGASGGGASLALPAALLVGSVLVLGTSVYLNRTDQLDGKLADAGVLLGVLGLLAGITIGLV